MKVTIFEEALKGDSGHWPTYIETLKRGFESAEDKVAVVAHRDVSQKLIDLLDAKPLFRKSIWSQPFSKWDKVMHPFAFAGDVNKYLSKHETPDLIMCLTMRLQHVLAWSFLIKRSTLKKGSRVVLLFVQGVGRWDSSLNKPVVDLNLNNRLMRLAIRNLRQLVKEKKVILASETEGMREELSNFTGIPFVAFPHPVLSTDSDRSKADQTGPLRFCCPGFARYEKGTDLLQQAIKQLSEKTSRPSMEFTLQWLSPFNLPNGSSVSPDTELVDNGYLKIIDRTMDADEYDQLLNNTDVVVMPYRRSSYYARVSRVAIEASQKGIPLIYTTKSWSEEHAHRYGAGIGFEDENVDSLVGALKKIGEQYQSYLSQAKERMHAAQEFYSCSNFRSLTEESK
ncbi:MAG: glycosyltransferase [Verrucomicrobia bacterium]|nr:glycosyltransferase [Verrucomicrobiota bacterium]MDA1066507.1 glycosyltransferase [Verrucomicrobiota bacterium]